MKFEAIAGLALVALLFCGSGPHAQGTASTRRLQSAHAPLAPGGMRISQHEFFDGTIELLAPRRADV